MELDDDWNRGIGFAACQTPRLLVAADIEAGRGRHGPCGDGDGLGIKPRYGAS